jgi:predicted ATP-grasp superfamily ATP-dependent carboligase
MKETRASQNEIGFIVFSGFNCRAVVAFLRTLTKFSIKFSIIASSSDDEIFRTSYRNNVVGIRESTSLNIDEIIRLFIKAKSKLNCSELIFAPSSEFLNRFMLRHLDILRSIGVSVPLVNELLYSEISDKQRFGEICSQNGLKVPPLIEFAGEQHIPFVAKPIRYENANGVIHSPFLIESSQDLEIFSQMDSEDFYFQKFISGNSYYLLYYFDKSGKVSRLSMRNTLQQPGGKSIIAAEISCIHKKEISTGYENLFRNLGFFGLVMVELRKEADEFYMIEANPRLWGPSQIFVDAKYNLFIPLINDWMGTDFPLTDGEIDDDAKYFWTAGLFNQGQPLKCITHMAPSDQILWLSDLGKYIASDVYMRSDTMDIYLSHQEEIS